MKTRLSLSGYHVLRWETCYQYSRQQPEEKHIILYLAVKSMHIKKTNKRDINH